MDITKYVTLENALKWSRLNDFDSIQFVLNLLDSENPTPFDFANLDNMIYKYAKRNISLATLV